ncbi:MAG TPA: hypothetical protein VMD59_01640 [Acidimicrobiales bacterium]|nr:hypothetical protein [Acidimicrobiales bacterium]
MGSGRRLLAASSLAVLAVAGPAVVAGATSAGQVPRGGAVASRPSQSTSSTGVSVASASDETGNDFVFWRGLDANLWMAIYSASTGSWSSGPTPAPGVWPLDSEPSAAVASVSGSEYVYVFFENNGTNLAYSYAKVTPGSGSSSTSVGAWSPVIGVSGMGPLGSPPAVAYAPVGGQKGFDVFWEGTDGNLWSTDLSGAGGTLGIASGPTKLGFGPLGSAPSAGADAGGNVFVFWQGSGNNTHVWEGWYSASNSTWSGPIDLGRWTGNTGSPPTVAIGAYGREYLFWQGLDGNLYDAYWNGYWTGWTYLGDGPLNSAPSAVVTSGITGYTPASSYIIVWKGTDLNLWYVAYNYETSTWSGPNKEAYGPLDS